jgi:uncharacterized damage-inducible protein DinB
MTFAIAKTTLATHLDYSRWATGRLLEACQTLAAEELMRDLKASHSGVLGTLQHIYFADRIWLARLEGRPQIFKSPDESPSLDELRQNWPTLSAAYNAWLEGTSEETLHQDFSYRNLKGEPCTLVPWKVLLHVVNHGSIHRGQVMGMFRQLGHTPPPIDLVFYYLG